MSYHFNSLPQKTAEALLPQHSAREVPALLADIKQRQADARTSQASLGNYAGSDRYSDSRKRDE